MFGFRADGKKVKKMDPMMRVVPHIMSQRHDSQTHYLIEQRAEVFDDFISRQRENGVSYNYQSIVIATMVRVLRERPKLNRFIMNGRVFQRNSISVSLPIKKVLKDNGEETVIKVPFDGSENIKQVKQKMNKSIILAQKPKTKQRAAKLLKIGSIVPNIMLKFLVWLFKVLDKRGLLGKNIVGPNGISPFHTSFFITDLKSIKLGYLYHHLYDFGTTGLFLSLGKESLQPIVNSDTKELEVGKVVRMGFVSDERFVDGLFYSNTLKLIQKYLNNPDLLLENPNEPLSTKKVKKSKIK